MDIRNIFISLALCGLFVFLMLNWTYRTQLDNGIGNNIQNDTVVSNIIIEYNSTFSSMQTETTNQSLGFETEGRNPTLGQSNLIFFTIFETYKTVKGISVGVFSTTTSLIFGKIFGGTAAGSIGTIILAVISSILIITFVLLAWRLVRQGE